MVKATHRILAGVIPMYHRDIPGGSGIVRYAR